MENNNHKFLLGVTVRDMVTNFTGTAIGRLEYLNGCKQYGVKGKIQPDGKMPDVSWIDEQQLELVDEGISKTIIPLVSAPGCDSNADSPK